MGCPIRATMDVVQLGEALGLPGLARPVRVRGRLDRRHQPRQAAHRLRRRDRVRPPQDDDDRPREAPGRRPGPPGGHPTSATSAWSRRSGARCSGRPGSRSGSASSRTATTRRRWSRRSCRRTSRPGSASSCAGPRAGWRGCRSTQVDLLIVDEIGKDISGTGMDTNVIGRHGTFFERPFTSPKVTFIVVGDLTAHTYGNAIGIGQRRLHDAPAGRQDRLGADLRERAHGLLAGRLQAAGGARLDPGGGRGGAVVPRARPRRGRPGRADQEHAPDRRGGRLRGLLPEVAGRDDLTRVGDPAPIAFDATGYLQPF